jgi:hypothetical protein
MRVDAGQIPAYYWSVIYMVKTLVGSKEGCTFMHRLQTILF